MTMLISPVTGEVYGQAYWLGKIHDIESDCKKYFSESLAVGDSISTWYGHWVITTPAAARKGSYDWKVIYGPCGLPESIQAVGQEEVFFFSDS